MADPRASVSVVVRGETSRLERDIVSAANSAGRKVRPINVKINDNASKALGSITGSAQEFERSLAASNARVLAFGASVGVINAVTQSFKSLIRETTRVEKALADINVILNENSQGLKRFSDGLFQVARDTASAFSDVTDAAVEFSRQGLSVEETLKRTRDALILTRLSGLETVKSVEALTAAVNGFSDSALDTTTIINRLANVDAAFAVSAKDLADSLSRAGSTAQDANVSFNELLAITTSVQQQTARGGAVIGNAFKTIFARIQRGGTIEQLKELGVAIDETQTGVERLRAIGAALEGADTVTRNKIQELAGGVRQINIISAALRDLNRDYSLFDSALATAANTTDEAIQRNAQLNQTLDALAKQGLSNVQQLLSQIGQIGLSDNLKGLVTAFNNIVQNLNSTVDGEGLGGEIGGKIARGILSGIGDFLTGPGLLIAAQGLFKIIQFTANFAKEAFTTFTAIGKSLQNQRALESSIVSLLSQGSGERLKQVTAAKSQQEQEKILLSIIKQETIERQKQASLVQALGNTARSAGIAVSSSGALVAGTRRGRASGYVPTANEGLIPSIIDESISIRRGVGGARPNAKAKVIPNFNFGNGKRGTIVANTDEILIDNFKGSSGTAVFNREMLASVGGLEGAKRFGKVKAVANGSIPNFAPRIDLNYLRKYGRRIGKGGEAEVFTLDKFPSRVFKALTNPSTPDREINTALSLAAEKTLATNLAFSKNAPFKFQPTSGLASKNVSRKVLTQKRVEGQDLLESLPSQAQKAGLSQVEFDSFIPKFNKAFEGAAGNKFKKLGINIADPFPQNFIPNPEIANQKIKGIFQKYKETGKVLQKDIQSLFDGKSLTLIDFSPDLKKRAGSTEDINNIFVDLLGQTSPETQQYLNFANGSVPNFARGSNFRIAKKGNSLQRKITNDRFELARRLTLGRDFDLSRAFKLAKRIPNNELLKLLSKDKTGTAFNTLNNQHLEFLSDKGDDILNLLSGGLFFANGYTPNFALDNTSFLGSGAFADVFRLGNSNFVEKRFRAAGIGKQLAGEEIVNTNLFNEIAEERNIPFKATPISSNVVDATEQGKLIKRYNAGEDLFKATKSLKSAGIISNPQLVGETIFREIDNILNNAGVKISDFKQNIHIPKNSPELMILAKDIESGRGLNKKTLNSLLSNSELIDTGLVEFTDNDYQKRQKLSIDKIKGLSNASNIVNRRGFGRFLNIFRRNKADGYMPNFVSGLPESITREVGALQNLGFTKQEASNAIRISTNPTLKNKQNPLGVGVYNSIQETSLTDAISKNDGATKQFAGASRGLIPNFQNLDDELLKIISRSDNLKNLKVKTTEDIAQILAKNVEKETNKFLKSSAIQRREQELFRFEGAGAERLPTFRKFTEQGGKVTQKIDPSKITRFDIINDPSLRKQFDEFLSGDITGSGTVFDETKTVRRNVKKAGGGIKTVSASVPRVSKEEINAAKEILNTEKELNNLRTKAVQKGEDLLKSQKSLARIVQNPKFQTAIVGSRAGGKLIGNTQSYIDQRFARTNLSAEESAKVFATPIPSTRGSILPIPQNKNKGTPSDPIVVTTPPNAKGNVDRFGPSLTKFTRLFGRQTGEPISTGTPIRSGNQLLLPGPVSSPVPKSIPLVDTEESFQNYQRSFSQTGQSTINARKKIITEKRKRIQSQEAAKSLINATQIAQGDFSSSSSSLLQNIDEKFGSNFERRGTLRSLLASTGLTTGDRSLDKLLKQADPTQAKRIRSQSTKLARGKGFQSGQGALAASFVAPMAAAQISQFTTDSQGNQSLGGSLASGGLTGAGFGALFGPIGIAAGGATGAIVGFLNTLDETDDKARMAAKSLEDVVAKNTKLVNSLGQFSQEQSRLNDLIRSGASNRLINEGQIRLNQVASSITDPEIQRILASSSGEDREISISRLISRRNAEQGLTQLGASVTSDLEQRTSLFGLRQDNKTFSGGEIRQFSGQIAGALATLDENKLKELSNFVKTASESGGGNVDSLNKLLSEGGFDRETINTIINAFEESENGAIEVSRIFDILNKTLNESSEAIKERIRLESDFNKSLQSIIRTNTVQSIVGSASFNINQNRRSNSFQIGQALGTETFQRNIPFASQLQQSRFSTEQSRQKVLFDAQQKQAAALQEFNATISSILPKGLDRNIEDGLRNAIIDAANSGDSLQSSQNLLSTSLDGLIKGVNETTNQEILEASSQLLETSRVNQQNSEAQVKLLEIQQRINEENLAQQSRAQVFGSATDLFELARRGPFAGLGDLNRNRRLSAESSDQGIRTRAREDVLTSAVEFTRTFGRTGTGIEQKGFQDLRNELFGFKGTEDFEKQLGQQQFNSLLGLFTEEQRKLLTPERREALGNIAQAKVQQELNPELGDDKRFQQLSLTILKGVGTPIQELSRTFPAKLDEQSSILEKIANSSNLIELNTANTVSAVQEQKLLDNQTKISEKSSEISTLENSILNLSNKVVSFDVSSSRLKENLAIRGPQSLLAGNRQFNQDLGSDPISTSFGLNTFFEARRKTLGSGYGDDIIGMSRVSSGFETAIINSLLKVSESAEKEGRTITSQDLINELLSQNDFVTGIRAAQLKEGSEQFVNTEGGATRNLQKSADALLSTFFTRIENSELKDQLNSNREQVKKLKQELSNLNSEQKKQEEIVKQSRNTQSRLRSKFDLSRKIDVAGSNPSLLQKAEIARAGFVAQGESGSAFAGSTIERIKDGTISEEGKESIESAYQKAVEINEGIAKVSKAQLDISDANLRAESKKLNITDQLISEHKNQLTNLQESSETIIDINRAFEKTKISLEALQKGLFRSDSSFSRGNIRNAITENSFQNTRSNIDSLFQRGLAIASDPNASTTQRVAAGRELALSKTQTEKFLNENRDVLDKQQIEEIENGLTNINTLISEIESKAGIKIIDPNQLNEFQNINEGINNGLLRLREQYENSGVIIQDAVSDTVFNLSNNLGDAFSESVARAKATGESFTEIFGNAFRSIAADASLELSKVFARQAFSGIGGLFGAGGSSGGAGAGGGIVSSITGGIGSLFGFNRGGTVRKYAGGGNVPALLTGGEFVIPPEAARSLGSANLNKINQGSFSKFAGGGFVTGGSGVRDDVFQPLQAGSFVVKKSSAQKQGGFLNTLAQGGLVKRNQGGYGYLPLSIARNPNPNNLFAKPLYQTANFSSFGAPSPLATPSPTPLFSRNNFAASAATLPTGGGSGGFLSSLGGGFGSALTSIGGSLVGSLVTGLIGSFFGSKNKAPSRPPPPDNVLIEDKRRAKIAAKVAEAGKRVESTPLFSATTFANGGMVTNSVPKVIIQNQLPKTSSSSSINSIPRFANGGMVGTNASVDAASLASGRSGNSSSGGVNVNIKINMNGNGEVIEGGEGSNKNSGVQAQGNQNSNIDSPRFADRVKNVVLQVIGEEKRPGGSLNKNASDS